MVQYWFLHTQICEKGLFCALLFFFALSLYKNLWCAKINKIKLHEAFDWKLRQIEIFHNCVAFAWPGFPGLLKQRNKMKLWLKLKYMTLLWKTVVLLETCLEYWYCPIVLLYICKYISGPNVDLLCIRQLDNTPFVKIMQSFTLMENTYNKYWIGVSEIFGAFFLKKVSFSAKIRCCPNVLD